MRVVIDTNVIVSALLSPHGNSARILDLILLGEITPVFDDRILAEYREVLSRGKFGFEKEDVSNLLDLFLDEGESVIVPPLGLNLEDPDDAPFLEVAEHTSCDYLITGNSRHFPESSRTVTPATFLADRVRSFDELIEVPGEDAVSQVSNLSKLDEFEQIEVIEEIIQKGEEVIGPIILLLGDDNPDVRWGAIRILGELREKETIEPLIHMFYDSEPRIQVAAAISLGKFGDGAIEHLENTYDDESVRERVVFALRKTRKARAAKPLIKALSEDNESIIDDAIKGLGEIGDPIAIPFLAELVADTNQSDFIQREAIKALGDIGSTEAMEPLIKAIGSEEIVTKASAIRALGGIDDKKVIELLIDLLADKSPTIREAAALALGATHSTAALEPLIQALNDNKTFSSAATALGELESSKAVKPLIDILIKKRDQHAAESLGKIGNKKAVGPLIEALQSEDDPYLQEAAAVALGNIRDARAIDALLLALNGTHTRREAAIALGKIGDQRAIEPLIETMQNDYYFETQAEAASVLSETKDPLAVNLLIESLKSGNAKVRYLALTSLAHMGPFAEELVNKAQEDSDAITRRVAKKALDKLRG